MTEKFWKPIPSDPKGVGLGVWGVAETWWVPGALHGSPESHFMSITRVGQTGDSRVLFPRCKSKRYFKPLQRWGSWSPQTKVSKKVKLPFTSKFWTTLLFASKNACENQFPAYKNIFSKENLISSQWSRKISKWVILAQLLGNKLRVREISWFIQITKLRKTWKNKIQVLLLYIRWTTRTSLNSF